MPVLTPDQLARLHDLSVRFSIESLHFTPGSQLAVAGLDDSAFERFRAAVTPLMQPLPDNQIIIHSCNDQGRCSREFADTSPIARRLASLAGDQPLPARLKIGISGCSRCCTMARVRDVGIFPAGRRTSTWTLSFGGNGGYTPRIGDIIATALDEDELMSLISRAIEVYRRHARTRERTAPFMKRYGLDIFLAELKKNSHF